MSKRWGMVAGALLLLCAAPPMVLAATESMVTLTLGGERPSGTFAEVAQSGTLAGLSVGYRTTPWLEAGLDLGYFRSAGKRDGWARDYMDPSTPTVYHFALAEHWSVTELGLYGRAFVHEGGRLSTYLHAGVATYAVRFSSELTVSVSSSALVIGGNEQEYRPGCSGGAGVRYRVVGGTHLGVEVLYHQIFGKAGKDSYGNRNNSSLGYLTVGATLGFGPGGKGRSER